MPGSIDLHTHSTASDGTLTPAELVSLAARTGLEAIALTDHDTTAGLAEFEDACARGGIQGVPGIEISASWYRGSVHILGYFIRREEETLEKLLREVRGNREQRNAEMLRRLRACGIEVGEEELRRVAREAVAGRPHIAALLVEKEACQSVDEAFRRYLGDGRAAYVRRFLPLPGRVIAAIHAAGGVAVLAHPFGNPRPQPASRIRKILRSLRRFSLDGIEAYYGDHSPEQCRNCLALAEEFGLVVTGGSDFHGGALPEMRLGVGTGELRVPTSVLTELSLSHLRRSSAARSDAGPRESPPEGEPCTPA